MLYILILFQLFLEKLKSEQNINELLGKCPKYNNINEGASTSGINISSETSTSNNNQETNTSTTQNQTKSSSNNNVNCIPWTAEQVALVQILWVNKMHAIQLVEYWES